MTRPTSGHSRARNLLVSTSIVAAAAAALASAPARAETAVWANTGDFKWDTAANWSTGVVPSATTIAEISDLLDLTEVSVPSTALLTKLSGGLLIVNSSLDSDLEVSGEGQARIDSTGLLIGNLTQTNTALSLLNAATVNSGTIDGNVTVDSGLFFNRRAITGNVSLSGGIYLGHNDFASLVNIGDGSTVTVGGGTFESLVPETIGALNLSGGQIIGTRLLTTGSYSQSGGTMAGQVSSTGATILTGGTVSGSLSGGKVQIGGTAGLSGTLTAATAQLTSTGTLDLDGGTLDTDVLSFEGGTLRAIASSTVTGAAILNSAAENPAERTGTISARSGVTLTLDNVTLLNTISGRYTYGSVTDTGTVVVSLSAPAIHELSAGSVIAGGRLKIGNNLAGQTLLGLTSTSNLTTTIDAGGTLDVNGLNTFIPRLGGSGTITNSGAGSASVSLAGDSTFGGVIEDGTRSITINKSGSGTLTLTGANTYTGVTEVRSGTLALTGDGSIASGNVTVFSGATLETDGGAFTAPVSLAVEGQANFGGDENVDVLTGAGAITINKGVLTLGRDGVNSTFTGTIGGEGDLAIDNGGGLRLNGNVTIGGGLTVNSGSLRLRGSNSFGAGITVGGGALLLASNNAAGGAGGSITTTGSTIAYADGVDIATPITIASDTTRLTVPSGIATQSGAIGETGGARPLEVGGAGTLRLTANNTYTGLTTVTDTATLSLSGTSATSGVTIDAGAALVTDGGTFSDLAAITANGTFTVNGLERIGSLAGGGSVVLDNPLHAGFNNASTTYSGTVSGAFGLVKFGTGTLTLSGQNSHGATGLLGGTLALENAGAMGAGYLTFGSGHLTTLEDMTLANELRWQSGITATLSAAADTTLTLIGLSYFGAFTGLDTQYQFGTASNTGTIDFQGDAQTYSSGLDPRRYTVLVAGGKLTGGDGLSVLAEEAAAITVNSGATLDFAGQEIYLRNLLGEGRVLNDGFDTSLLDATFAGNLGGTQGVSVRGGGLVSLTGANTFTGATRVEGGILELSGDGSLTSTDVFVFGDGTLEADGGALASTTSIYVDGQLRLFGGEETVGFLGGIGLVNLANGAQLNVGSGSFSGSIFDVEQPGTLVKTGSGTFTVSGTIDMVGSVEVNGGVLALSGDNTIGGGVTVGGGTLRLLSNNAVGGAKGQITTTGSVIDYADGLNLLTPILLNSDDTQLNVTTGTATQSGVISETGGARLLEKTGAGTLVLASANTFTGGVTISGGTLQVSSGANLGGNARNTLTIDGGTLLAMGGMAFNGVIGADGGTIVVGEVVGSQFNVQSYDTVFNGLLTKTSTGTFSNLLLQGTGSGSGGIQLDRGILGLRNGGSMGSGTLTMAEGTMLNLFSSAIAMENAIVLGGGAGSTINALTGPATISGRISGGSLVSGFNILSGNLTLTGTNTYTGSTRVAFGTLSVAGDGSLASTDITIDSGATFVTDGEALASTAAIANSGTFRLTGGSESVGSIAGSGGFELGGDLSTGGNNASTTVSGVISGTGNFSKTGTGTLTLTAANTYTGNTRVRGGTLDLTGDGALASDDIVVRSGATLITDGGALSSAAYLAADGQFTMNGAETITSLSGNGTMTLNNLLTLTGTGEVASDVSNIAGTINGTRGGFIKNGLGTLNITGNISLLADYSGESPVGGTATVNAGTLILRGANTFDGGLFVNDATVRLESGQAAGNQTGVITASNAVIDFAAGQGIEAMIMLAGDNNRLNVATGGVNLFGQIRENAPGRSWEKTGAGELNLRGGSYFMGDYFTGDLTITEGAVNLASSAVISNKVDVVIGSAGTVAGARLGVVGYRELSSVSSGGTGALSTLDLRNGAQLIVNGAAASNYAGAITGPGSLYSRAAVYGGQAGGLTLTGISDSFTGLLVANYGGSIAIIGNGRVGALAVGANDSETGSRFSTDGGALASNAFLIANGTVSFTGSETIGHIIAGVSNTGSIVLTGEDTVLTLTGAANPLGEFASQFDGVISGTGRLAVSGGAHTLTGANTYSGFTRISGGTLNLTGAGSLASSDLSVERGGTLLTDGGALSSNAFLGVLGTFHTTGAETVAGLRDGDGTFVLDGLLTIEGSDDIATSLTTLSGAINGTGGFTKNGAGILAVTGKVDLGGTVTVNEGRLVLSGNNTIGGITVGGGTLRLESSNAAGGAAGRITTTGSVIDYANGITVATPITLASNTTQLNVTTGSATQSGAIGQTGGARPLEKTGAGTLVLAGNHTFTGDLTVTEGQLTLGVTDIADAVDLIIGSAGTTSGASLLLTDAEFVGSLSSGADPATRQLLVDVGQYNLGLVGDVATTYAGRLAGTGNLLTSSSNELTLTGVSQQFTGTLLSSGTGSAINLTGSGAVAALQIVSQSGATITTDGGAFLDDSIFLRVSSGLTLTGSETVGSLSGNSATTGVIALNGNGVALTLTGKGNTFNLSGSSSFAGAITGTGRLAITGATHTLTGASTYTGSTSVSGAGTALNLTGSGALASTAIGLTGGATLTTDGGALAGGATVTMTGSTLVANGAESLTAIVQSGGFVAGTGPITVASYSQSNAAETDGSVVINTDTFSQSGSSRIEVGTTVNVASSATLAGGSIAGTLGGPGTATVTANTTTLTGTIGGNVINNAALLVSGGRIIGTAINNEALVIRSGAFDGGLTNADAVLARGAMSGNVINTATGMFDLDGNLTGGGGSFVNRGLLHLRGHSYTGLGAISTSGGTVVVTSGSTLGGTSFSQSNGVTFVEGRLVAPTVSVTGGTFSLSGQVAGNVTNSGAFVTSGSTGITGNFANSGLALFQVLGGRQSVSGTWSDSGNATVAFTFNTETQAAGLLDVGGAVSGDTAVEIATSGATLRFSASPTVLIETGGGGGTFSLVGTPLPGNALVNYTFGQLAATRWGITSNFNYGSLASVAAAVQAARVGQATGFHQPVSRSLAEAGQSEHGTGLWLRAAHGRHDDGRARVEGRLGTAFGDTRTDLFGFEGGVDATLLASDGWRLRVGVMGGRSEGDASAGMGYTGFAGSSTAAIESKVTFAGLYGVLTSGGFTLDFDYRHEWQDLTISAASAGPGSALTLLSGYETDGQADVLQVQASYQVRSGRAFARPVAGLVAQRGSIDALAFNVANVGAASLAFSNPRLVLGHFGLELGYDFDLGTATRMTPFVNSRVWGAWDDDAAALASLPGQVSALDPDNLGAFGETRLGLRFAPQSGRGFGAELSGSLRHGGGTSGYSLNAGIRYGF